MDGKIRIGTLFVKFKFLETLLAEFLAKHQSGCYECVIINPNDTQPWPDIDLLIVEIREDAEIVKEASQKTKAKIIALVNSAERQVLTDCIRAGAFDCLTTNDGLDEFLEVISQSTKGYVRCSAVEAMRLPISDKIANVLTKREIEILGLIREGCTNDTISRKLHISPYTTKNHVHNILEKLRTTDRHKAVRQYFGSHAK